MGLTPFYEKSPEARIGILLDKLCGEYIAAAGAFINGDYTQKKNDPSSYLGLNRWRVQVELLQPKPFDEAGKYAKAADNFLFPPISSRIGHKVHYSRYR